MKKRHLAFIAAFIATTIYGINHTIAKEVMPIYIGSFGFIMLRLLGATALFWIISLFTPKEKVERKDFITIFFAAIFGVCVNMLAFFRGLELSTPINSGVIITLSPVIVLILSYLFLKEKINPLVGAAGVSAVPDSARVVQMVGQSEDPQNFLLMHAMAPNVAGVIGSAVAAGILWSVLVR